MNAISAIFGKRSRLRRVSLATTALCAVAASLTPATSSAASGQPVGSFGHGGTAVTYSHSVLNAAAIQADGKIVAVGEADAPNGPDVFLARFNSNGTPDSSFGTSGVAAGPSLPGGATGNPFSLARAVAIQPDGKIVVVGTATSADKSSRGGIVVERFNANGSLDSSFGSGGYVEQLGPDRGDGYAAAVQSDGKIVAAGTADEPGSNGTFPRAAVLRFNADGSSDPSFATAGVGIFDLGPYSYPYAVVLQKDGKIVIAGSQSPGLQVVNALIARITPSGTLDSSFNGSGAYANQYAVNAGASAFYGLAIQADGKIVAVGAAASGQTGANSIAVRFDSSGHPDPAFGTSGVATAASAVNYGGGTGRLPGATGVTVASNGDLVLSETVANGALSDGAISALRANGSVETAFGTNGTSLITSSSTDQGTATGIAQAPNGAFVVPGNASDGRTSTGEISEFTGFGALTPPPAPKPGGGTKPPALRSGVRGVSGSYRVGSLKAHPVRVTFSCNVACRAQAIITVTTKVARQLNLRFRGRGPVTLARAGASLSRAGTRTITLRFPGGLLKALGRLKSLRATLSVSVTSVSPRKTQTFSRTVSFHR